MYPKPFSKYRLMKTMGGILFILFTCFLIMGCSQENLEIQGKAATSVEDKNKAAIRAVLEKEFTGPDEEYLRLSEELEKQQTDPSYKGYVGSEALPDVEEITSYVEETYSAYFTELGFESFVNSTPAFMYHYSPADYHLSIADIEVVQSDNPNTPKHYDFTAQVEHVNNMGEITQFEISGMAICSEEGKIGRIEFKDDGLRKKIYEDLN